MSTIGNEIKMTIFGESHGSEIGVTLDGIPAGEEIDFDKIVVAMSRRSPGNILYSSARKETDIPEIISGIYNEKTTGMPICAIIKNTDFHSADYNELENIPRPGHADFTAMMKYKNIDLRGGGHFSGRLTAPLVFAGALCAQILSRRGVIIAGHVYSIANITDTEFSSTKSEKSLLKRLMDKPFPVIDNEIKKQMGDCICKAKEDCDSVGGIVEIKAEGVPIGIGGPLFDGLEGAISSYVLGIPAAKGIEFGAGFSLSSLNGSESNDEFYFDEKIKTETNNMGGILGGISNGMPIILRVAFKPTPSIGKSQKSVNIVSSKQEIININGRHDPCIVPRAVPCVESAVCIAITEQMIKAGLI